MTQWISDAPPAYDSHEAAASPDAVAVKLATRPCDNGAHEVLVSVIPPLQPDNSNGKTGDRAPVDIVCVIDVSSSMSEPATLPAEPGQTAELTELSILDVVRHALRVIMSSLGPQDRLALVPFSSHAHIAADLTFMDPEGKRKMGAVIDTLRPNGSTNLWDGLKLGMNLFNPSAHAEVEAAKQRGPADTPANFGGANHGATARTEPATSTEGVTLHNRIATVFCLTDGCPNVTPPRGHVSSLQRYLAQNPLLDFTVHTFGFGYQLDSALLLNLARVGGGTYGFIPDLGMVGTVFVHALANALTTFATQLNVEVEYDQDRLRVEAVGEGVEKHGVAMGAVKTERGARTEPDRDVLRMRLDDLRYGQNRDIVLRIRPTGKAQKTEIGELLCVLTTYKSWTRDPRDATRTVQTSLQSSALSGAPDAFAAVRREVLRLRLAASLLAFVPNDPSADLLPFGARDFAKGPQMTARSDFTALLEELRESQHPALADAEGQASMALENAHWEKWGRHYLPSLALAHALQRCSNFRDPGQLEYGAMSPLFIKERDRADDAFDKLPPPKPLSMPPQPSFRGRGGGGGYRGGPAQGPVRSQVHSMAVWNSRTGPCVAGECLVLTPDGEARIDSLKRGDRVITPTGNSEVAAVLRTRVLGTVQLCQFDGLKVTPWHPIAFDGKWQFPVDAAPERTTPADECQFVYSLLLSPSENIDSHAFFVGNLAVVALGSGAVDGVRAHPFLSDYEAVVRSLSLAPGFTDEVGVVQCAGAVRKFSTGEICGFVPDMSSDNMTPLERSTEVPCTV